MSGILQTLPAVQIGEVQPGAASSISSSISSHNTVTVNYTATETGPPTSYGIYYKTSSGVSTSDTFVSGNSTSTTKSGLAYDTTHYYRVAMINSVGTTLDSSDSTFVTTGSPGVATSVAHAFTDYNDLDITYTAGADATSYGVYYKTSANVTTSDTFVSGSSTTTALAGLSADTTYYYRVAMINSVGTVLTASDSTFTTYNTTTFVVGQAGQTYNWTSPTGTANQYVIFVAPNKSLELYVWGGGGGGGMGSNWRGSNGGIGSRVTGTYACPGETLKLQVGGGGGFNDKEGYVQGSNNYNNSAAAGGGASAIIQNNGTELIVAGGGGGGAPGGACSGAGGGGQGSDSWITSDQTGHGFGNTTDEEIAEGADGGGGCSTGYYGAGGDVDEGGQYGHQFGVRYHGGNGGYAQNGDGGNEGGGGTSAYGEGGDLYGHAYGCGGGGGGGYYGGGGGANAAGGGCGSSYKKQGINSNLSHGSLGSHSAGGTGGAGYYDDGPSNWLVDGNPGQSGAIRIVVAS